MARRKGKDINGILLLDKPLGRSSNSALQNVRYLFNAKKAGHTGSLDPLATGVLPICFGEASKVTAFLLDSDKRYICEAELGTTTTTGDKEGEVLQQRDVVKLDEALIEKTLDKFRGAIQQIPPMHSALKHKGQPLYKLARKGIDVERPARDVIIHELKLLEFSQTALKLEVFCSKGTYIRTLAQDIGEALGCGAHLSMLRRTEVTPFDSKKLYTIEDIERLKGADQLESILLSIDSALVNKPRMQLNKQQTERIRNGLKVKMNNIPTDNMIRLYNENDVFIGIGYCSIEGNGDQYLAAKRLMNTQKSL